MTPEAVLKGIKTRVLGRSLLCLEKTTSTNDVILELARQGALEGTTVTADIQTQGRGRQGRRWAPNAGEGAGFFTVASAQTAFGRAFGNHPGSGGGGGENPRKFPAETSD